MWDEGTFLPLPPVLGGRKALRDSPVVLGSWQGLGNREEWAATVRL